MKTVAPTQFMGFPAKRATGNFWCYPNVACLNWDKLLGSEHKVLDCILRHTWGFNRSSDRISLSQLERGVRNVHSGVGLSKKQIIRALRSLQEKGFITSVKSSRTNEYSLVTEVHKEQGTKVNTSSVVTSPVTSDESIQVASVEITHTKDNTEIEEAIEKMYRVYSELVRPGVRLTHKARENIRKRFVEYHPKEIVAAIRNSLENDYWEDIVKKQTVAWFFDSEERIAGFLALGPNEWHEKE